MDVNNLTLPEGYQMPFSLEAEQAVLGCVLMDPNCMPQVLIYLRPEYFYLPQHKEIFSVMVSLDALGNKIDPLIILETLKNNGTYDEAAGKNYLFQLAQRFAIPRYAINFARAVILPLEIEAYDDLFSVFCIDTRSHVTDNGHAILLEVVPFTVRKEIVQYLSNRGFCRESIQVAVRNAL